MKIKKFKNDHSYSIEYRLSKVDNPKYLHLWSKFFHKCFKIIWEKLYPFYPT